ncbi:viral replication protein [uncultured Ruminococcus sp.]|uniref:viral replication protein n=1 Tax=uncultured Ruminococcus sp. TaxID=165186 RepID=UPI0025E23AF7|nr:viral replication protein [uncultured Ruminococcus sp.]
MSEENSQSRKWLLTINNPETSGLNHEEITRILMLMNVSYFCIVDEIATTGTPHTHIFVYRKSPIRFSTLKNKFPVAHIDKSLGSCEDNRNYLRKEGKWSETQKAETNLIGTFEEYGELPDERQENNPDYADLLEDVENGMSTGEIVKNKPQYIFRVNGIDDLRNTLKSDIYLNMFRQVDVTYLCSSIADFDRTYYIYNHHKYSDICRITNYDKNGLVRFDGYNGQDVLVFEDFASQINIENMINYINIFPIQLPARYRDKVACYTKVYISSNLPLSRQYITTQEDNPELWNNFLSHIHKVIEFSSEGEVIETVLNELPIIEPQNSDIDSHKITDTEN